MRPSPRSIRLALALVLVMPARPALGQESDVLIEVERRRGPLATQAGVTVPVADAYDADPMGLVAFAPLTRFSTIGTDQWEVWVCRSTDPIGVTMSGSIGALADALGVYFDYLSDGRYVPTFVVGSDVAAGQPCGIEVQHSGTTPRIYVHDQDTAPVGGVGSPGTILIGSDEVSYEGTSRRVEISGTGVVDSPSDPDDPHLSFPAHEIGHSIFWAHAGAQAAYDNALDLMSSGWAGTNAWNLYSAGWIDPEKVVLHHGGDRTHVLGPVGSSATRMVVVTTGEEGHFYTLSMRDPDEPVLDPSQPDIVTEPAVEVYEVDQRPFPASGSPDCQVLGDDTMPCFGITAEVRPHPANPAPFPPPFDHLHPVGTSFTVAGVPVVVTTGSGGTLVVDVSGGLTGSGWFLDDDSSVFEGDIEWIAGEGVTKGCNPPRNDFYCPNDHVTRGQMAAFLVRAFELSGSAPDVFSDDETSIFEADINLLAQAGITKGCGPTSFCPNDHVTRGQMAAFLRRAFGYPFVATDSFTDDETSIFEADINAIAAVGVTKGCGPTTYCPLDPVTRGQMAAFLHRAITTPS